MSKRLRVALGALGVFLAVAGAGYYWFVVESTMPANAYYELDIDKVRRMVAAVPGDKPQKIEFERVGAFSFPATAIVAGDGSSTVSNATCTSKSTGRFNQATARSKPRASAPRPVMYSK